MDSSLDMATSRGDRILHAVMREGRLSVEELSRRLGISEVSIRRDLRDLETKGLLRRDHGGAAPVEPLSYHALSQDSSFQEQIERHADEKRRIGLAAANLINDGETVALTAGTTTTQVARSLLNKRGVKVFTNGVNIALELSRCEGVTVSLCGGVMRGSWFSLVGAQALRSAENVFADKAIVGAVGLHPVHGLTDSHAEESEINRTLLMQARRRIVVADHSKLGVIATHRICAVRDIHQIVTGAGAGGDMIALFTERGIEIERV